MSESTRCGRTGQAIYGFGVLGAWVHFWQQADGFWWHVLAILQGPLWPAFLTYDGLGAF